MKKIGTLTFHRAYNYGAILQAYALQRVLQEEGYDSEIIDYRNCQIEEWFHQASLKSKLFNIYELLTCYKLFRAKRNREKKFDQFLSNRVKLSPLVHCADVLGEMYSAVIVGSDQIWNLDMTKKDFNYFLPFKGSAIKIAYAASFGTEKLKKEFEAQVKEYLSDFLSISVREEAGRKIIHDILPNYDISKNVDPTLLLDKESWVSIEHPYMGIKPHSYVLMYFVAPQTDAINVARRIAEENGLETVLISTYKKTIDGIRQLSDVGPEEFIWLIHNAYCLITTSFHGMVFSLNLNTPFLYELNREKNNTNSRLIEISNMFSLESFQITLSEKKTFPINAYNWKTINKELEKLRKASKDSLFESLS